MADCGLRVIIVKSHGWRTEKKTYKIKPEPTPDAFIFEKPVAFQMFKVR